MNFLPALNLKMSSCESSRENLPQLNEDVYGIILKFVQQFKRDELNSLLEKVKKKCDPWIYGNITIETSSGNLPIYIESNEKRLVSTSPLLQTSF